MRSSTSSAAADPAARLGSLRLHRDRLNAWVGVALVLVLVAGAALRLERAADPPTHLSHDELAYGRLATNLVDRHDYGDPRMSTPMHWAPGAPGLFAIAYAIDHRQTPRRYVLPAVPWAQALVGVILIVVIFALGLLVAGPSAGLAAASVVALYPPLIDATASQISEPLGAACLAAGLLLLVRAWRRGDAPAWLIAGAMLGAAVLVRADLLLAPFFVAAATAALRRRERRPAAKPALLLAAGVLLAIAPWILYTSFSVNRFVPVSDGGGSTLFVASYLPGSGSIFGLKRELGPETRARLPWLSNVPDEKLRAEWVLQAVARRRPDVPYRTAIRQEAAANLRRYALGRPVAYARMTAAKIARVWFRPSRGSRASVPTSIVVLHLAVLLASLAGLVIGIAIRREPLLVIVAVLIAYTTVVNAALVAEPRHNLPLMPVLVAAGAAGWWLCCRRAAVARSDQASLRRAPFAHRLGGRWSRRRWS